MIRSDDLFTVKAAQFEGPFHILLELIQKRKMHIGEIALSQIVDDYVAHIQEFKKTEEEMIQFLSVLSTLLLIKSRALLPGSQLSLEEKEEISQLEENLERFEHLKNASQIVQRLHKKIGFVHVEGVKPLHHLKRIKGVSAQEFKGFKTLTLGILKDAATGVMLRIPEFPDTYGKKSIQKKIRLEDVLSGLMDRLNNVFSCTFSSLVQTKERAEIVLHFLALLELVKMEIISTEQKQEGGDILIERRDINIPRYGHIS